MTRPLPARLRGKPYTDDLTRGYVVRGAPTRTPSGRSSLSWWYGPESGWGTTFGPLDYGVRVFGSRAAATEAWERGYHGSTGRRRSFSVSARPPTIDTVTEARSMAATRKKFR